MPSPTLRHPTPAEAQLLAAAVASGAMVRRDDAYADFLNGDGPLPLNWGTYVCAEDLSDPLFVEAADKARARRDAFHNRLTNGDLSALGRRVVAERAAGQRRAA